MTLIKLPDLPLQPSHPGETMRPCRNPSHNPPTHMVLAPGRYRHTCPGCGVATEFSVLGHELMSNPTHLGS